MRLRRKTEEEIAAAAKAERERVEAVAARIDAIAAAQGTTIDELQKVKSRQRKVEDRLSYLETVADAYVADR